MVTFYQYFAFLLPLVFVFIKGYFLSIEFSLYPYFVSKGLLPYKNILDQHFPAIFFGSIRIPYLFVNNPTKLLILLLTLNLSTILFLQLTLKKQKVSNYQFWVFIYGVLSIFFAVNTLWLETFVVFFLSLCFYLNTFKRPLLSLLIGIIISQVLLLRPTMVFFLLGYFFIHTNNKKQSFYGLIIGLLGSFFYLLKNNITLAFYDSVVIFNQKVYSHVQNISPSKRQMLGIILLIGIFLYIKYLKRHWLDILLCLSTIILIFPRFGLEHLQVFSLVFVYLLATTKENFFQISIFIISAFVVSTSVASIFNYRYGNYFYTKELYQQAERIKNLPGNHLYLYGASDLLYQLTGKLPSGNIYLPSLPWYLNYKPYSELLMKNLQENKGYVVVDTLFSVDGQKLTDSTPQIYKYIKMNYLLEDQIGPLEVYKPKQ